MKACYKKLFVISALFLSTSYVAKEIGPDNITPTSYRTIAGERANINSVKVKEKVSITKYQVHQKGIFDAWFDSTKLFGRITNVTQINSSSEVSVHKNANIDQEILKDFKDLSEKYTKLQDSSKEVTKELARASEEISSLKQKLEDAKQDKVDSQIRKEKIAGLEELIAQKSQELDTAKETLFKFEETKENLRLISEKLTQIEAENEALKAENEKLACQLEESKNTPDTDEVKRLEAELEKISAELQEYKDGDKVSDSNKDSDDDDKDKKDDRKDRDDKDTKVSSKLSLQEQALMTYLEIMQEQVIAQRQASEEFLRQQLMQSHLSTFTAPQINSYFGSGESFMNQNMNYLSMIRDFNEQSYMIKTLNHDNGWTSGYKDYYGQSAPMMNISKHMPWGMQYTPEQSIQTQNYDFSRHGYNWGSANPVQHSPDFNLGINTGMNSRDFSSITF